LVTTACPVNEAAPLIVYNGRLQEFNVFQTITGREEMNISAEEGVGEFISGTDLS